MKTYGSLVLTMMISVPTSLKDERIRFKKQTLARFNCVTLEEAAILKQRFLALNEDLSADYVNGEWTVREFV